MQRNTAILLSVGCLLLLAVAGVFLLWPEDDEEIINRNLARLVELTEKEGEESFLVIVRQSSELVSYFAEEIEVFIGDPLPVIRDPKELQAFFADVKRSLQTLSIRILRNDLTVAEDGLTARMELEAEGTVTFAGEIAREQRGFSIEWIKEEGDWVIRKVELEERVMGR